MKSVLHAAIPKPTLWSCSRLRNKLLDLGLRNRRQVCYPVAQCNIPVAQCNIPVALAVPSLILVEAL